MFFENSIKLIYAIVVSLSIIIPLIVSLITNIKVKIKIKRELLTTEDDAKKAELEAADAKAKLEMQRLGNELIENAEVLYKDVSALLKKEGKSAGIVKKDSVMSKLQAFALENNYVFDSEYWDKYINETVELTKSVNKE